MAEAARARRRRRAAAAAGEEEDEPEPAPAAPAPAPVGDERTSGDERASGASAADEEDDQPRRRGGRPSFLRRGAGPSRRAILRTSQPGDSYHRPSAFARLVASTRELLFGSQEHMFLSRYQVAASTPLQMGLYFGVPYSLLFASVNQLLFYWKASVWDLPLVVAVVSPMVFWVWALLEPIRLLLGYVGNLRERGAWLGGFWVLTIFPQTLVHLYFIFGQNFLGWFTMSIEVAMSVLYLFVLFFQLLVGYGAIKRLIVKAMADFHLQPVEIDEASTHL